MSDYFFFQFKLCLEIPQRPSLSPLQTDIVHKLAGEASRKISAIFGSLSSGLQKENQTLMAKTAKLDSELHDITKACEKAQLWRENVLNGCPVLFEETGMIFTLKPLGQLMQSTDKLPQVSGSSTIEVESTNDGMFVSLMYILLLYNTHTHNNQAYW